ncbi:hypothetical protein FLX56_28145, partial [Synechococcus moorigangaii CMS01]|nr:hypothetical protein [Synechococcus moorigangaii CMS01]
MDLSQLKWFKNVNPGSGWAYANPDDMPLPEAKIFRLEWKSDKTDAQKPNKGDLIALVQKAKVTHIVEVLDDTVYDTRKTEFGIYRVVKAIWMPPQGFDWSQLPHQKELLGPSILAMGGNIHELPTKGISESQLWQDLSLIHISEPTRLDVNSY